MTFVSCSIANVYYSQGKYAEALEYHNKSLEIKLRVVGPDHPLVADTKVFLAPAGPKIVFYYT